jgi:hypothetical protein
MLCEPVTARTQSPGNTAMSLVYLSHGRPLVTLSASPWYRFDCHVKDTGMTAIIMMTWRSSASGGYQVHTSERLINIPEYIRFQVFAAVTM